MSSVHVVCFFINQQEVDKLLQKYRSKPFEVDLYYTKARFSQQQVSYTDDSHLID